MPRKQEFDLASMEAFVERCHKNIAIFEEAIANERRMITESSDIIAKLKERAQAKAIELAVRRD